MKLVKTVIAKTGHSMAVCKCEASDLPKNAIKNNGPYTKFYAVRNWTNEGHIFFYIARCEGKLEYHVYYPNGAFWSSYGKNFKDTIDGAIEDGWLYTDHRNRTK